MKTVHSFLFVLAISTLLVAGCRPATPAPVIVESATLAPTSSPAPTSVPPTATPQPAEWMFRGGVEHRTVADSPGFGAEWYYKAGGPMIASPFASGERLYSSDLSGKVFAIDRQSGDGIWAFQADGPVNTSPYVEDNAVYFGDDTGVFYALDAESGSETWRYPTGAQIVSSPTVFDGMVYFGGGDGNIYALDAQSGEPVWQYPTQGAIISSPAVAGDSLIIASTDDFLYALNRRTGEKQWLFLLEGDAQASPTAGEGLVFIGSMGEAGYFYAVDASSGDLVWKQSLGAPVISSAALVDETLYFGAADGRFYAITAQGGTPRWDFETGGPIISSPAVFGNQLYFGSTDGSFYTLNRTTGEQEWSFSTRGEIWSSPAVAGDFVYFGSQDGYVYALDRRGPQLALAPTATPVPLPPTPTMLPKPEQAVETGPDGLPWWNDEIFYEVFVRSFYDSDGDGTGDLQGLIEKLDYLNDGDPQTNQDLGITGLWLMPVSESPSYHGYDVVDYLNVEQDYGTNDDLRQLISEAHARGMLVIVDLVMNHTSSQHPWFLEAQTPGSPYENWYVWSETRPNYASPWGTNVWHPSGLRYYYGLFWEGMPDLNYRNGEVTEEMFDIIRFWLEDMGVDGFRLDAVRHLIEDGPIQENTPETHAWLQNFHRFVRTVKPEALTVGEAWTDTQEVVKYIGDEVDLAFEFDLAQTTIDSVMQSQSQPLVEVQEEVLSSYPPGQYATFLTNHDQNRLMSQLGRDTDRAKLAATLLLTQPGVPFIYYGEEIGMTGVKPDERIRTPMQWEESSTAGFTSGQPWEPLGDNVDIANVAEQSSDPDSLLNHYRELIRLREAHPALRTGGMWLVSSDAPAVYSFLRQDKDETLLVVVNLSPQEVSEYTLNLSQGPLESAGRASLIYGTGQPAAPQVESGGGFSGYQPLPSLPPRSGFVIRLEP